jgi:hypothetical protein
MRRRMAAGVPMTARRHSLAWPPTAVSAAESLHAPTASGISEYRLLYPDTRSEIPYYCRREPSLVRLWCGRPTRRAGGETRQITLVAMLS